MPAAEVNGVRINYQSAGSGEPVVFVPGFVTSLRLFDGQMEPVSREYHAVRYDLRGQGESSAPEEGYATSDHAADLGALIEHLNLSRVHLVGASLGGAVAVHYALEHPERVRSLTLAGAVVDGFPGWPSDYQERLRAAKKLARSESPEAALKAWLTHPFFAATRDLPALAASVVRASGAVWLSGARGEGSPRSDWSRLAELAPPLLVVEGEREVAPVQKIAESLKGSVRGASYQLIKGAGHLPSWDAPEDFTRVLLDFLDHQRHRAAAHQPS